MKKSILFLLVLLSVISLSTGVGKSYVRSPISSGPARGMSLAWNLDNPGTTKVVGGEITYNLNPAGSDNLPFSQVEQALMASFQAWEDIPTSAIAFRRGPDTTSTTGGNDDFLQLFWIENSTTTPDGLNLTGALAVSRTTAFSSGTRAGEILDGSLVFNGNEYQWGVNGAANLADIGEVATHEIGHLIGLSHTAIGGATMFPRSGEGRTSSRSLEQDDILAASSAYPAGDFLTSRGTLSGRVSDGANPIFGAHIAAVDSNGNVVSGALSQPDGSYSIQGLPPGDYTVYAEPLDPNAGNFYSKSDLSDFYSTANLDFLTTQDFQVSIGAGQQFPLDIQVTRGAPALDGYIVFDQRNAAFVNVSTTVFLGESDVTVGIAGPGLPPSGAPPLSISGPGITITSQRFVTTTTGLPGVLAQINVSPTAPLGARNIIVSNGSQRTIVTGALELQLPGSPAPPAVASAANFGTLVAPESIASVFGLNLGTITQNATSTPLPTSIGGSTVVIRDASGTERLSPLFFSSPFQINFLVPAGTALGQATIAINNGSGGTSTSGFQVTQSAPGLFSSNSTGGGLAAALVVRVRNNVQTFEPIAQPGGAPIPIDLGPPGDQVFLILYATGVRGGGFPACTIGGVNSQIVFAGPQGSLLGLDQVNVLLDRSLGGQGATHNILLNQDGLSSNTVTVVVQ